MNEAPAPKKRKWKFPKKKRDISAKIPSKSKGASEKNRIDTFFETRTYRIVFYLGMAGIIFLPVLAVLSLLSGDTLETFRISKNLNISEFTQGVYYTFIFVGAVLAAAIATWRGRQSEWQLREFKRQIQNSRFEKAIEMATDPTNEIRRGSGFQILDEMLFSWRESFDDTTTSNVSVLHYINIINFKLKKDEQQKIFAELYTKSRNSYNPIDAMDLYEMTSDLFINSVALKLWEEINNWRRKKFPTPGISDDKLNNRGIYASEALIDADSFFIFSGIELNGLKFFISLSDGRICSPTEDMCVNFRVSCFILIEMHKTIIDHVDFSNSYLFRINCRKKGQIDYKMSCIKAVFNNASVIDCNFEGADIEGASFDNTNISGSDFSQAENLTQGQFEKAYWIFPGSPQFPEGWTDDFVNSLARYARD